MKLKRNLLLLLLILSLTASGQYLRDTICLTRVEALRLAELKLNYKRLELNEVVYKKLISNLEHTVKLTNIKISSLEDRAKYYEELYKKEKLWNSKRNSKAFLKGAVSGTVLGILLTLLLR